MSPFHKPQTSMASNSHLLFHISFYFLITTNLVSCTHIDNYIVHMDLGAMPKPFSDHHTWYKSTLDSLSSTTTTTTTTTTTPPPSKLLYTYNHAISGFSASLTPSEFEALKSSPGYLHSTRDSSITLDTTYTSKFLGLNPISGSWPVSNYGKDVIVGVVDSGVWPESKSFKDDGFTPIPSKWKGACVSGTDFNSTMCNNKLIGAQYFNKGLLAKNPSLKISMDSARDTDGHGTHTSSTAAGAHVEGASYFGYAKGNATGMAPLARVAVYKAIWDEGSSVADIIAALDKAITDGVDVVSVSLGSDVEHIFDDVIAIATLAAVEKGIFVSLSAGNNGPRWGTLHNGTPWALTVAAGTTDRQLGGTVVLGNGDSIDGISLYPESTTPNATLTLMNECDDMNALKKLQKDAIVVCFDTNGTAVSDQVYNVGATKVAGAIFITESLDLNLFLQSLYPTIFLDYKAGKLVMDYIKNNSDYKPTATLLLQKTFLGSTSAPKVASYSSRGPSPTCQVVLKPDLMAPGDLILASWSRFTPVTSLATGDLYNDFNVVSGTSMACPHASGIAALLKGAHPEWTPAMIRSAMMTSAGSLDSSGEEIKDMGRKYERASALAMGAGHVNPNKAMEPGLVYDTEYSDYIDLLCALNYTEEQMKVITRSSSVNCWSPSMDLNYPSFIVGAAEGTESFEKVFWRSVTNVGEGVSSYGVKVSMGDGVEVRVEPEKLVFAKKYEKLRYRVTVTVVKKMKGEVVDGSISWIDSEGKYVVRTPIVVSAIPDKKD